MKTRTLAIALGLVGSASLLYAHDMFMKLDTYFLAPRQEVRIPILNGTFVSSEDSIAPDRVVDISLVSGGHRLHIENTAWVPHGDSTLLTIETGAAGTYVVGASTRHSEIDLEAADFNEYLEHDGIPDVLEARHRDNELGKDVRERYSKHVKAVFQVGDARTDDFSAILGYPAEIVPLNNPYRLQVGGELVVRCLVDGVPVAGQYIVAGGQGWDGLIEERGTRTDEGGVARFIIDAPGRWYLQFINMSEHADPAIDYESKWATLTFEIR